MLRTRYFPSVCEILLAENLAPHDLNCLIVDYMKPLPGELIDQIEIDNTEKCNTSIQIYQDNIYVLYGKKLNEEIRIYNKYTLELVNKWTVPKLENQSEKIDYIGLAVDENNVYIGANAYEGLSAYGIMKFNKNGEFICFYGSEYGKVKKFMDNGENICMFIKHVGIFQFDKKACQPIYKGTDSNLSDMTVINNKIFATNKGRVVNLDSENKEIVTCCGKHYVCGDLMANDGVNLFYYCYGTIHVLTSNLEDKYEYSHNFELDFNKNLAFKQCQYMIADDQYLYLVGINGQINIYGK